MNSLHALRSFPRAPYPVFGKRPGSEASGQYPRAARHTAGKRFTGAACDQNGLLTCYSAAWSVSFFSFRSFWVFISLLPSKARNDRPLRSSLFMPGEPVFVLMMIFPIGLTDLPALRIDELRDSADRPDRGFCGQYGHPVCIQLPLFCDTQPVRADQVRERRIPGRDPAASNSPPLSRQGCLLAKALDNYGTAAAPVKITDFARQNFGKALHLCNQAANSRFGN